MTNIIYENQIHKYYVMNCQIHTLHIFLHMCKRKLLVIDV